MLYDISNQQSANETLIRLTSLDAKEIDTLISSFENRDAFLIDILKSAGVTVPPIEGIQVHMMHITSSADSCHSIKARGLLNLQDVIQNRDAELTSFLANHGITIDVKNHRMSYKNKSIDIQYPGKYRGLMYTVDMNPGYSIGRKIYYDYGICGFCSIDATRPYGSPIQQFPEILSNIDRALGLSLSFEWKANASPYKISFCVPLDKVEYIDQITINGEADENHFESLVDLALVKANSGHRSRHEIVAQCVRDASIAPEKLTIEQFTDWE